MHKPKILKDLEKLALHFVLDECVKRQNFLFENRCCYLKSSPLRTRKNSPRILRTTTHYNALQRTTNALQALLHSSLPPFHPSFLPVSNHVLEYAKIRTVLQSIAAHMPKRKNNNQKEKKNHFNVSIPNKFRVFSK